MKPMSDPFRCYGRVARARWQQTSGPGVSLAGALLCLVHALVDVGRVLVAGALVDLVADLLEDLVDLLVVLVGEILRLVQEAHAAVPFFALSTSAIRATRGSARISSRLAVSGIRQFGYSSVVPGRLGWRSSPSTS